MTVASAWMKPAAVLHVKGNGDWVDIAIERIEAGLPNAFQDLEDKGTRGSGAQTSAPTPRPRLEYGIGDPPWMQHLGGPTSANNAKARPGPPDPEEWWNKGWGTGWWAGWNFAWEEWMGHIQHLRAQGQAPPLRNNCNSGGWVPGGEAASSSFAGTGSDQAEADAAKVAWYQELTMHRWRQQMQRNVAWWKEHSGGGCGGIGCSGRLQ